MNRVQRIAQDGRVRAALSAFRSEVAKTIADAVAIQQIPAPTYGEQKRARYIERQFVESGLSSVEQDAIYNVFGTFPGGKTPPVVVSAHSDTVFPIGTDLSIRYENGSESGNKLIYGPGLVDNALGVAGLISVARAMRRFNLRPAIELWFVANVAEEGLGNLKGMRAVVDRFGEATAYIVVEGGSFGQIFNKAVGARRYRIEVATAGGHSWGDFGEPSAVHILSRIVTAMGSLPVSAEPKSSYNVGVIEGGTAVNAIAASASCLVDLRSTDPGALALLVEGVRRLVSGADSRDDVHVTLTQIGNRPPGEISSERQPVGWAVDALHGVGCQQVSLIAGSTDANLPLSLGLPAVCIGLAKSGNTHRLDEYLDPAHLPEGLGQLLLLTLAASGFEPS
jgi:tripeptide aminopeptidase